MVTTNNAHQPHQELRVRHRPGLQVIAVVVCLAGTVGAWWWLLTGPSLSSESIVIGVAAWLFLVGLILAGPVLARLPVMNSNRSDRNYAIAPLLIVGVGATGIVGVEKPPSLNLILALSALTMFGMTLRTAIRTTPSIMEKFPAFIEAWDKHRDKRRRRKDRFQQRHPRKVPPLS
jgi:hypothetical protein